MKIHAILFDLDDTLWPVAPVIAGAERTLQAWIAEHYPAVAAAYDLAAWRQRRNALIATDTRFSYDLWALRLTLLTQVFAEFGIPASVAEQAMAVFADARNRVDLYPDVMDGLQNLAKLFRLGSLSNGFADLHAIGLAHHFEVMLAAHQVGCAKPAPEIFCQAIHKLSLRPEQIVFVGDDVLLDVAGAQAVGMQTAWMRRHPAAQPAHPEIRADFEVENLHQLLKLLQ